MSKFAARFVRRQWQFAGSIIPAHAGIHDFRQGGLYAQTAMCLPRVQQTERDTVHRRHFKPRLAGLGTQTAQRQGAHQQVWGDTARLVRNAQDNGVCYLA